MQRRPATRLSHLPLVVVVAMLAAACGAEIAVDEPASPSGEQVESGEAETTPPATTDAPNVEGSRAIVAAVIDGDTIALGNGARLRLLQIDAPETGGECYSRKSARVLREILPAGTEVRLQADPKLDRRDRFGRLLRYVFKGDMHVNLALVRRGAASVWFYEGVRGRYADQLLRAAERAKANEVGLWQACRGTVLDPLHAIEATSQLPQESPAATPPANEQPAPIAQPAPSQCDPSYPDFCIPPPPPDLDCAQVPGSHFTVRPPDPHGFDGNDDGVGCES
jgi:endonuclease YncB( thermonuclease family)